MMKFVLPVLFFSINAVAGLNIGATLPKGDVAMKGVDGKTYKLEDAVKDKKGALVIFTCNTCPYAKAWKDRITEIGKDAESKGLAVVLINSNDSSKNKAEDMAAMKTQFMPVPYVVDATSDVARAFGAEKTPDVFLFDKNKKLVYKGAVDDNSEDAKAVKSPFLKTAINQLLAGEPVKPAETKSVGCGIKFRK